MNEQERLKQPGGLTKRAVAAGRLISFEGIDGAGKSTHIGFVADFLRARGVNVVTTREPGGTALGEQLRELLLHQKMQVETEALLMFAARSEHIAEVIAPALARGDWVITDRFTDASFAYQSGGRGLERSKMDLLERWVHPDLQPDLTFLFDVPLAVARSRLDASRALDKFEREQSDFFDATRNEYLRRAAEFSERFRIIDSTRTIAQIQAQLAIFLHALLEVAAESVAPPEKMA
ncbi:MAG: dTMP kinase [Janthinobacterium sp.]|jgi:dTMP kinase